MDYLNSIKELLEINLTENGNKLAIMMLKNIPNCWAKRTSSTGKYHRKSNGFVPSTAEHTYEMLYAAVPLLSMLDIKVKTNEADVILLAITLHDAFKYGSRDDAEYNSFHTYKEHDKLSADIIHENKNFFKKIFDEEEVVLLEEIVRFHSGRWSTDAKKDFSFKNLDPKTMFVHMLDMLSSRDLLKVKMEHPKNEQH